MIQQPTLKTSRLKLRPFCSADDQRVAKLVNDEETSRNLKGVDFPYSLEDATSWISELPGEWEQGKSAVFAICVKGTDSPDAEELVGAVGIVLDQQSSRGELGYWVGRDFWGQGIATEACQSMLDFGFNELGLNKVVAECLDRNPASANVLKKIGMVQEGLLKQHFRKNVADQYCDVLAFGILKSAWNARK